VDALLGKPLLLLGDGGVRVLVEVLLPALCQRLAQARWFARRFLGGQVLALPPRLEVAADGGGGDSEAMGGLLLGQSLLLHGGDDALSQVQRVGLHGLS